MDPWMDINEHQAFWVLLGGTFVYLPTDAILFQSVMVYIDLVF